ncbi:T9SS type A sorting domain-containing protein [Hymenobacter sp. BT186]|uniref:T9SS type A sorting domain-containing protein n=1 Tax=Hymenobacter telluris TaxID=2816474 RepID=A0A939JFD8_9BACT|nr:T9SS type A sorting domain-containing protein [Hymenobacter telluris]MBO0360913.1 T9SS type A sorting domain-containing protein [Hymenobacter telluris]MBW3376942.1 T9SS type A sorting domain-containing protein [Hymenobacter norwichensis]
MKRTILGVRARQLLLGLATAGTVGGGAWWWQHQAEKSEVAYEMREEHEGEEEEDEDRPDRPDLALEQDIARTMDPALGRVPSERLVPAQQYAQQLLAQRANMRPTAGSIALTQWFERGPANVGGRTRALLVDAADPTGNTVWAGSVGGGLWKTTNGLAGATATTWQSIDNFFANLAITALVADPRNANTMYFGTGEGFFNADAVRGQGIWKSTNHGVTWAQLPSTNGVDFQYVQKLLVHPTNGDLYAGTRNGLFRSSNGGTTWVKVLGSGVGAVSDQIADIEIAADGTLYVGTGLRATDGIYRSSTGNASSWTKLNTLANSGLPTTGYYRIELACAPSRAQRVYAIMQNSANSQVLGLYRSDDGGDTWVTMTFPGGTASTLASSQAWYDLIATVSPTNPDLIYAGGLDMWRSATAGDDPVIWTKVSNWTAATTSPGYLHADHHAIVFATPDICYFGNDGGVSVTQNAAVATPATPIFSTRVNNYNVTQLYACAVHPTNVNYFLGGTQDNGTQRYNGAGTVSTTVATGGDGAFCFIDEDEPQYQFTSYVYAQYRRSTNNGTSFANQNISSSLGSFINPTDYDSRSNAMFGGYGANAMFRWLDATTTAGTTATSVALPGAGTVTHVTVSPGVLDRVYVGTNSGKVLRIDSARNVAPRTPVITEIKGTFSGSVSSVAVDKTNEQHLVVTYSNYGVVSVWETTNGGTAWRNVEGNLPDMPIRWALFDPTDGTRVLLATELGVWGTDNLSAGTVSWIPVNNGLANVRVDMLRMRTSDKQVAAATHGRGLYTTDALRVLSTNKGKAAATNGYVRNAYPNPFREQLNVELDRPAAAGTTFTLTDMQGRVVHRATARGNAREQAVQPPSNLASGAYILQVKGNGQIATRRVVKQ